jgi:hypothetical protein
LLTLWYSNAASLTVALAVGLLIGLNREKQKDPSSPSETAGVRTFTLVALLGAIAALLESEVMVAVLGAGVIAMDMLFFRHRSSRPLCAVEKQSIVKLQHRRVSRRWAARLWQA